MVSDDIDMLHIIQKGHLDHKVRMAVNAGVDPVAEWADTSPRPGPQWVYVDYVGDFAPSAMPTAAEKAKAMYDDGVDGWRCPASPGM